MTNPGVAPSGEESGAEPPQERVIDLSVEVSGTPEQVWAAIATGPGISSWYVPTTVEERTGGALSNRFGAGPEMLIPGRVAAWEPPHRVVFDGGEGVPGLAFEWLVEARDQSSCVVRLVNSGFVQGTPWDDQYDGMLDGWWLFLFNLQLHLAHFAGRTATALLPTAIWPMPPDRAWATLITALGLPAAPSAGDRVVGTAPDAPAIAGTVTRTGAARLALVLDDPAPGTAILACEGVGEQCGVSVWLYLYGADAVALAERDEPRWSAWLQARGGLS